MSTALLDEGQRTTEPTGPVLRRRSTVPRPRAVVGGLLVATAAVVVFAAYLRAGAPPATSYVAVSGRMAPGTVLTAADLALVPLELPPEQAALSWTSPERLVGAVVTTPLQPGELVTSSDVRAVDAYVAPAEVAVALPRSRALAGSLRSGERVDVLATYGTGPEAVTRVVVTDALVVSHGADAGLGQGDVLEILLGVGSPDEALAVTHAVTVGEAVLARAGDTAAGRTTYRIDPTSGTAGDASTAAGVDDPGGTDGAAADPATGTPGDDEAAPGAAGDASAATADDAGAP